METFTCTKCLQVLSISEQAKWRPTRCRPCIYKAQKEWRYNNPEQMAKAVARTKRQHLRIRQEALAIYSGDPPRCACCGETELTFLALDHIEGGGTAEFLRLGVAGSSFYAFLRNNGWPPGIQVLCHNCNQAKGSHGKCPHVLSNPN